jgi:hypothetical protein
MNDRYMQFNMDVEGCQEGDIFRWSDGNKYRLVKKTTTAVAVERYFWFDAVGSWLVRKIGRS